MRLVAELGILRSDDWSVKILGQGSSRPTLFSMYSNLREALPLFDEFGCRQLVLLIPPEKPYEIDLSSVSQLDRLESLHIEGSEQATLKLDPNKTAEDLLDNLRELVITGPVPTGFPPLASARRLGKLRITWFKGIPLWLHSESLVDLRIDSIKGKQFDFGGLTGLPKLRRLCLSQGSLQSAKGITTLTQLTTLHLAQVRGNPDLSAVCEHPRLENLMIEAMRTNKDWDFLAKKSNWKSISLEIAESVEFAREIPDLQEFYCSKVLTQPSFGNKAKTYFFFPDGTRPALRAFYESLID